MIHSDMVITKMILVEQMHNYILNLGDEEIYETWIISGVPDCPCEEDFRFFAEDDEEWNNLCELFGRLTLNKRKENR